MLIGKLRLKREISIKDIEIKMGKLYNTVHFVTLFREKSFKSLKKYIALHLSKIMNWPF